MFQGQWYVKDRIIFNSTPTIIRVVLNVAQALARYSQVDE